MSEFIKSSNRNEKRITEAEYQVKFLWLWRNM